MITYIASLIFSTDKQYGVKMKKIVSSLLLCLAAFTGQAYANDKTLVIATNPTWPPMQMVDLDKNIVGYEVDLMKAIAAESGYKVEFMNTAWDGIFATLESKNSDIVASCVTITDARKKRYLFSEPTYGFVQALVVPEESTIAGPKDLKGKRIGVQIGTTAIIALNKIDKDLDIATYDDVGLALEDLANGRVDAVMCDDPVALYYAGRKEGYSDKMKVAFMMEEKEYIGFVMLKENQALMEELNAGYKKILENGKEKEINEKWFGAK